MSNIVVFYFQIINTILRFAHDKENDKETYAKQISRICEKRWYWSTFKWLFITPIISTFSVSSYELDSNCLSCHFYITYYYIGKLYRCINIENGNNKEIDTQSKDCEFLGNVERSLIEFFNVNNVCNSVWSGFWVGVLFFIDLFTKRRKEIQEECAINPETRLNISPQKLKISICSC